MKQEDKVALKEWESLLQDIEQSTTVDELKSPAEIDKHRLELEADREEWIKFFFPKYARYPFAPFHKKAINRIINNPEWYEVLSWSRELAKSTIVMFIVMYLVLTKKKKNVILASADQKNAIRLLAPYKANLEANGRIKAYYGEQQSLGDWRADEFITLQGVAFRALGAGQSPRGSRAEEVRPDVLLPDDFDTDEGCRNPDIIDQNWDWFEKALYPTRSISEPLLVLWCGNIIAKDCCIVRAGKMADHHDIVNIRDEKGQSTWPEKNTEAFIDRSLSKISMKAVQGEYYNNPISGGSVFKTIKYGKMPPFKRFQYLVIYGDPTQSEKRGTAQNKKGSRKAVWLVGGIGDILYVFKGFIFKGTNYEFLDYFFVLHKHVGGAVPIYCYLENNGFQDPFFRQVFQPSLSKMRKEKGVNLSITPDEERKTDKAVRIEANLEPINREGRLILNENERDDPHMKELENELSFFTMGLSYPADGIDTIEGAKRIIENKMAELLPLEAVPIENQRSQNKKRR